MLITFQNLYSSYIVEHAFWISSVSTFLAVRCKKTLESCLCRIDLTSNSPNSISLSVYEGTLLLYGSSYKKKKSSLKLIDVKYKNTYIINETIMYCFFLIQ